MYRNKYPAAFLQLKNLIGQEYMHFFLKHFYYKDYTAIGSGLHPYYVVKMFPCHLAILKSYLYWLAYLFLIPPLL